MSTPSGEEAPKGSKRPAMTAFKQQQLKAWQPILTPVPVIATFLIVGIVFIPIGIVLVQASNSVVEITTRYDNLDACALNHSCTIDLIVHKKMQHPVYLYYRLDNYYQNHRRYVKSRNDAQLRGSVVKSYSALEDCDPRKSLDGIEKMEDFFLPCGLIAWSLFNDTFTMRDNTTGAKHYTGEERHRLEI